MNIVGIGHQYWPYQSYWPILQGYYHIEYLRKYDIAVIYRNRSIFETMLVMLSSSSVAYMFLLFNSGWHMSNQFSASCFTKTSLAGGNAFRVARYSGFGTFLCSSFLLLLSTSLIEITTAPTLWMHCFKIFIGTTRWRRRPVF